MLGNGGFGWNVGVCMEELGDEVEQVSWDENSKLVSYLVSYKYL